MKKLCLLTVAMFTASLAQAASIDSTFSNLDFDESTASNFPDGFDSASGYDVPGWMDYGTIDDAGIEPEGAWWSPYQEYSAFAKIDNGAYNLSSYVIQDGDVFDLSFVAKGWATYANTPGAQLTVSLFYGSDPSTNVLGSINTGVLTQGDSFETWTSYSDTIAATAGSVGQTLGVRFQNTSGVANTFANIDEVSISTVPEPTSLGVLGLAGLALAGVRRRRCC